MRIHCIKIGDVSHHKSYDSCICNASDFKTNLQIGAIVKDFSAAKYKQRYVQFYKSAFFFVKKCKFKHLINIIASESFALRRNRTIFSWHFDGKAKYKKNNLKIKCQITAYNAHWSLLLFIQIWAMELGNVINVLNQPKVAQPSIMDLGKQLLESAKEGLNHRVHELMCRGAPFTTDWVSKQCFCTKQIESYRLGFEILINSM